MCMSVQRLPSHALQFLQSWMLKFFCQWEKPETCQVVQSSFKSNYHGTGPFSDPLLAYWGECWGPCSPMHTVPASSSCSSATAGLSSSHTEWMEPPEECGHKRRNAIFAECYHPTTAQRTHATNTHLCPLIYTHRTTLQVWACLDDGAKEPYFIMRGVWMALCAPVMLDFLKCQDLLGNDV